MQSLLLFPLLLIVLLSCEEPKALKDKVKLVSESPIQDKAKVSPPSPDIALNDTIEAIERPITEMPDDKGMYSIRYYNEAERLCDTLVNYRFLQHLDTEFEFNYPSLKHELKGDDLLRMYNDSIEVLITAAAFDTTHHKLYFSKATPGELLKIDERKFWGTDGSIPRRKILNIELRVNGEIIIIPDKEWQDLYEPNLQYSDWKGTRTYYANTYLTSRHEIIIRMDNSDAAGSYTVLWFIRNGVFFSRIISHNC